jgi:hypothetical protein
LQHIRNPLAGGREVEEVGRVEAGRDQQQLVLGQVGQLHGEFAFWERRHGVGVRFLGALKCLHSMVARESRAQGRKETDRGHCVFGVFIHFSFVDS